jgi:hypothetical protein
MEMNWVIKGLPLPVRLVLFAVLAAACAVVQFFLIPSALGTALGLLVLVPALLLLWSRNLRNKPADLGFEDWQPVTAAEFNRIKSNLAASRRRSYSALHKPAIGIVLMLLCLAAAVVVGGPLGSVAFLDAAVLLLPFAFGGNVYLWSPHELALKMGSFDTVIAESGEGGEVIVTPYLRLDKDKEGRQIPEDVRLMVEPRRKPADFLGVQFQVALNKGPNGTVPYLYAVFLCRGQGPSYATVTSMSFPGWVHETGGDKEYGYVVLRQKTSGTGYHTTEQDCRRLFDLVKEKLGELRAA